MNEGKTYPCFEEEDGSCLTACEPMAVPYAETFVQADNRNVPGLPKSWDELLDCLKEGEEEFERGEAIPWEMATQNIRSHLANHVA